MMAIVQSVAWFVGSYVLLISIAYVHADTPVPGSYGIWYYLYLALYGNFCGALLAYLFRVARNPMPPYLLPDDPEQWVKFIAFGALLGGFANVGGAAFQIAYATDGKLFHLIGEALGGGVIFRLVGGALLWCALAGLVVALLLIPVWLWGAVVGVAKIIAVRLTRPALVDELRTVERGAPFDFEKFWRDLSARSPRVTGPTKAPAWLFIPGIGRWWTEANTYWADHVRWQMEAARDAKDAALKTTVAEAARQAVDEQARSRTTTQEP
jgi:hypothetical protein